VNFFVPCIVASSSKNGGRKLYKKFPFYSFWWFPK